MIARRFVLVYGALFMCLGTWISVQPRGMVQFADLFLTSSGLWIAVALRLTVGVLLWLSAAASRVPRVLRALGALFVFSGFVLPIVGLERMRAIADWGVGLDDLVMRGVGLIVIGLGAFIVWSVWPRGSER